MRISVAVGAIIDTEDKKREERVKSEQVRGPIGMNQRRTNKRKRSDV